MIGLRKVFLSLFSGLFFGGQSGAVAGMPTTEVVVRLDVNASGKNTIKRGFVMPGLSNTQQSHLLLQAYADEGFELVNFYRLINLDYTNSGPARLGNDGLEIYRDGETFGYRLDRNFLGLLTAAREANLTAIAQISGTPPDFPRDPRYQRIPYEQRFILKGREGKVGELNKEFELPSPEYWGPFANVMADWMAAVEKSVAQKARRHREKEIIWIGSEEPGHTIGWPVDLATGDLPVAYLNDTTRGAARVIDLHANLRRYIDHRSLLSKALAERGVLHGEFQLNAPNLPHYGVMADYINMPHNRPPLDFLTIQNYSGHEANGPILQSLRAEFGGNYPILFDRYDFGKGKGTETAAGVVDMLGAEQVLIENADIFYGYCANADIWEHLGGRVMAWLNHAPLERKLIEGLPVDVHGMAFADAERLWVVIWNVSQVGQMLNLSIPGHQYSDRGYSANLGMGRKLHQRSREWPINRQLAGLDNIEIGAQQFALIELQADGEF